MRLSRLLAIPLLTILLFSAAMPAARAATGADQCFCYFAGIGATKTDGAKDATTCRDACMKDPLNSAYFEGSQWAQDFGQYPTANLRCWQKRDDCEKDLDMSPDSMGVMTIDGVWGQDQPAECTFGSHYCYAAENAKTYLNVSIAGTDSVINIGEYISVVYNYLMGFAMTVAIVFLMVGGLRYVIGGVSAESIKGAKKMMTQAIEGFVLLMFAYAILYTVSPQLIKLQVPKLPMSRQVVIGGNDCALLLGLEKTDDGDTIKRNWNGVIDTSDYGDNAQISSENGAVLKFKNATDANNPVCGVLAEIMTGPDQAPTVEGMTCQFNYCAPGKGGCATLPTGNKCMLCEEVGADKKDGVVPSASLCSSLDPGTSPRRQIGNGIEAYEEYDMCGYTHDPWVMSSFADDAMITTAATAAAIAGGVASGGTLAAGAGGVVLGMYAADVLVDVVTGTCAALDISCGSVHECSDYNNQLVKDWAIPNGTKLRYLSWPSVGSPTIDTICAQDPCKVGVQTGDTCKYYTADQGTEGCQSVSEMEKLEAADAAAAARQDQIQADQARCLELLNKGSGMTESERAEYDANC